VIEEPKAYIEKLRNNQLFHRVSRVFSTCSHVLPVFSTNQEIIKECKHRITQKGMRNLVHEALKGKWGTKIPKGITKNS
jgi:hypothetical protein